MVFVELATVELVLVGLAAVELVPVELVAVILVCIILVARRSPGASLMGEAGAVFSILGLVLAVMVTLPGALL